MVTSGLFLETVALILHSKKRNTNTVAAMATSEMEPPVYPITCRADDLVCNSLKRVRGLALSKMVK